MDAYNLALCAVAGGLLDLCALVLILCAYKEKKTGRKRWYKISGDMELAEKGASYSLECDEIIIGRHASADIRLMDMSVSRYHAVLTVSNGIWVITDLGSKSGLYINGRRVKQSRLYENDLIKFGNYKLIFRKRSMIRHCGIQRNICNGVTGIH